MTERRKEALNKYVRNAQSYHSRKVSREKTMEDQLHYLLVSSDPLISELRAKKKTKLKLNPGAVKMVKSQ